MERSGMKSRDLDNGAQNQPFKIYFHCRWYTTLELEVLHNLIKNNQNLELYIGFCGNISYPKAQDLRDSFQYCLDNNMNILIETDAPYLSAQVIRWQQNTPAKIIHTYEYISDYFYIPIDQLQKKTHDNFMSLYYPG
jgi:Tat protein secretion system quality control protein TatD with DNase activity